MKIFCRKSNYVPPSNIIEIEVNYSIDSILGSVFSAKDKIWNRQEFEDFIINASGALLSRDFEIVDEHWSNRRNSLSYYISFYPRDNEGNLLDKYMMIFSLSNHVVKNQNVDSRNRYNQYLANKHRRSNAKQQEWIFENIVIGSHKYKSYRDALRALRKKFDDMQIGEYV